MATSRIQPTRESVTTIRRDGGKVTLHPADTSGPYTLARRLLALLLMGLYAALPFIQIQGKPAVLLDIAQRRFHFFGTTLATEDLWILFFLITGVGFSLFFITALLGRIWCGWACPQTVFLEHAYRRLERWIDGHSTQRRELDQAPWDTPKLLRRLLKHTLFLLLSAIIAHLFLAYFISPKTLFAWLTEGPLSHKNAFLFMLASTVLLYFNFSWFREQLCIIICPYGRLQSALIDDDTIVIGYDEKRGEPRGKPHTPGHGDCINCLRCVQVCPTGIDIRQGLQIECVGCANCIDACDAVMAHLGKPKGLIRYASLNAFAGKARRLIRPRILLYLALMTLGIAAALASLSRIQPGHFSTVRMTGTPFFVQGNTLRNQFQVRLINKQAHPVAYTLRATTPTGMALIQNGLTEPLTLAAHEEATLPLILSMHREDYTGSFDITLLAEGQPGNIQLTRHVKFLGPDPRLLSTTPTP